MREFFATSVCTQIVTFCPSYPALSPTGRGQEALNSARFCQGEADQQSRGAQQQHDWRQHGIGVRVLGGRVRSGRPQIQGGNQCRICILIA